jgi:hypothetical protein
MFLPRRSGDASAAMPGKMSIPQKPVPARRANLLNSPDLNSKSREGRADWVRKDLTRRLKRVCENLSSADFEDLIAKMTRQQLRGERII